MVLLLAACADAFNPLETDPSEAGINLQVVGCELSCDVSFEFANPGFGN